MKVGLAVAWFISAMLRFAITDAPDVNRSGFNQLIHRHTVMGSVMPLHLVLDEKLEKTVMSLWKLPSNSGWNMTSWILRDTVKVGRKNYLLVEVVFTGKYWDRVKLARKNFSATDRAKEFSVILPQVLLAEFQVKNVYNQLSRWLKTPIDRFAEVEQLCGTTTENAMRTL